MNPAINMECEPSPEIERVGGAVIVPAGIGDEAGNFITDEDGRIIQGD